MSSQPHHVHPPGKSETFRPQPGFIVTWAWRMAQSLA